MNKAADRDDIYNINVGINGGKNGFEERIKYIKVLLKIMKTKTCPNIKLNKELGRYSLSTSRLKNTKHGKNNQSTLERYDDK